MCKVMEKHWSHTGLELCAPKRASTAPYTNTHESTGSRHGF